jgi:hypothetical protein
MNREPVNETIPYSLYSKTKVECVRWIATVDEDQRTFSTSICKVLDVHDAISLAYKSACTVLMRKRPNGLGISGGAPIDRESARLRPAFKKAAILRAQSAVRCMPGLDGSFVHRVLYVLLLAAAFVLLTAFWRYSNQARFDSSLEACSLVEL